MPSEIKHAAKDLFKLETQKFQRHWPWYFIGLALFVIIPSVNYYLADGVFYNKVLVFHEDIDPLALRTDKDEYCPGEMIKIETAFCKTRHFEAVTSSWFIVNGQMTPLDRSQSQGNQLPIGCVPEGGSVTLFDLHRIPEGVTEGFHRSVGTNHYLLSGGRVRHQDFQTIPYYIKSDQQCRMEDESRQRAEHLIRLEEGMLLPDPIRVKIKE